MMRKYALVATLAVALFFESVSASRAALIELEFTAVNFPPTFAGIAAPTDPVSGVILYEAADVGAPIESLTAISLEVGNHSFAVGELGFITQPNAISTSSIIGGSINGIGGVSSRTSDFSLQFDRDPVPGVGANFVYASASLPGIWRTAVFTNFSLSAAPTAVPEPGTFGLLLLGLLIALPLVRRKPHRAQ